MTPMGWTHGDRMQMPRKKETTIHREPAPDHDTAEQLMVAAWPYCGVIQDIIDRLNVEHRAAPAGEPAAASGLQGHASLVGEIEGVHPPIGWVEVKIKLILDSPRHEAVRHEHCRH